MNTDKHTMVSKRYDNWAFFKVFEGRAVKYMDRYNILVNFVHKPLQHT